MTTPGTAAARGATTKIGPISGIVFFILFLVSFMVFSTEDGDAPDQKWIDFWKDSDNRVSGWIASLAMLMAAMLFLWFAGALRRRLANRAGTDAAYGSGIVYAALLFIAGFGAGVVPIGYDLGDVVIPTNPDVLRLIDGMYYGVIFLAVPYAIAGFLIPLFFAARGSGVLPTWLGIFGLVVGIVALSGPVLFVIPHALFLIWVLITSIVLLMRDSGASTVT
jgi:hypothetical protein